MLFKFNGMKIIPLFMVLSLVLACSGGDESESEVIENIVTAEKGTLSITVSSTGSISMANKEDLRFGIQGTVTEVLVMEADRVKAGDTLATLDKDSFQVALTKAESAVATAQEKAEELLNPSQSDLQKAEAAVLIAKEALDNFIADNASAEALNEAQIGLENAIEDKKAIASAQENAENAAIKALKNAQDAYAATLKRYYAIIPARSDLNKTASELLEIYTPDPLLLTLVPYFVRQKTIDDAVETALDIVLNNEVLLGNAKVQKAKKAATADTAVSKAKDALDDVKIAHTDLKHVGTVSEDEIKSGKLVQNLSTLAAAKETLAELSGGPDQVLLKQRKATLEAALLDLKDAKQDLLDTSLKAPISGVITELDIEIGDSVNANTVAFRIGDPSELNVSGQVDEIDIFQVRTGQEARISLNALPQLTLPGVVETIDLIGRNQGGIVSFDVNMKMNLPRRAQRMVIREGMSVTATIVVEEKKDILLVPINTIRREGSDRVVTVVLSDETRETRVVSLGMTDGSQIEIINGLKEGDQIVVRSAAASQSNRMRGFGGGSFGGGGSGRGMGGGGRR